MEKILEKIRLTHDDLKNFSIFGATTDTRLLEKLSKVNIIVGPNNSGKSRLLRGISKIDNLSFIPKSFPFDLIKRLINEMKNELLGGFRAENRNVNDVNNTIKKIDGIKLPDYFTQEDMGLKNIFNIIEELISIRPSEITLTDSSIRFNHGNWQEPFSNLINNVGKKYKTEFETNFGEFNCFKKENLKRHYIPILRGLRPFSNDKTDLYKKRTQEDYFKENNYNNHEITTGIDLYDEIKSCLLGDLEKRKIVNKFQDYLSKEFFENNPVAVIPKEGKQELALKIGREKEQQIFDLGDGLQSLLIISFCIYKSESDKNNFNFIFIEEPEIFMHPGLQRLLLKKMLDTKNCQFFFTTHSNHFLDITLDYENISVFRITKNLDEQKEDEVVPNFLIENVSSNDSKTLELLGVRDSSVFLSNCTIWVEGVTDRMYLRHYLRLYQEYKKKINPEFNFYKEDIHFSFIEYGGANLIHFDFSESEPEKINVKSITKNIFLIADYDKGKEKKHEELKKILENNYYPLPAREIENLISLEILKNTIIKFENKKNNQNFNFKNRLQHKFYLKQYLGTYIENKIIDNGELKYSYTKKDGSGTIRDKIVFAKTVIESTNSWEDLSKYAKDLIEKTFLFIERQNN